VSSESKTTGPVKGPKKDSVSFTSEEQNVVLQIHAKFPEYFQFLETLELTGSVEESDELKHVRPFLMSNEVSSSTVSAKVNRKGGKGKKSSKKSRDVASTFSVVDRWSVGLNNYTPSNKPYAITQSVIATATLTSSTTLETFTSNLFRLSNIVNDASFQAIFDQYRITLIEFYLIPNTKNLNTSNDAGLLTSVVDYDDATNVSSVAQANLYPNAIITTGTIGHYLKFQPHTAVAAYAGAFTSFTNVASPWIDIASDAVQHFGIKTAWTATSVVMTYNIDTRYHLEFRNVR